MGAVMVRCPTTGREIPTGIVSDRDVRTGRPSARHDSRHSPDRNVFNVQLIFCLRRISRNRVFTGCSEP